jgi:hypothetical protein
MAQDATLSYRLQSQSLWARLCANAAKIGTPRSQSPTRAPFRHFRGPRQRQRSTSLWLRRYLMRLSSRGDGKAAHHSSGSYSSDKQSRKTCHRGGCCWAKLRYPHLGGLISLPPGVRRSHLSQYSGSFIELIQFMPLPASEDLKARVGSGSRIVFTQ